MRRTISIGLAAVLAVGVVLTVLVSRRSSSAKHLRIVHGVTGAENERFFADPRVKAAFARHGLDVRVYSMASDQVVTAVDAAPVDFAFLTDAATAAKLAAAHHGAATSLPLSSPMVVATSKDVAQRLVRAGVAQQHGGWWTLDTKRFFDLVHRRAHWNELPGNTASGDTRLVFISSPGVTTSEGAMYASLASFVANSGEPVSSVAQVDKIVNAVSPLFLDQEAEQTNNGPHTAQTQNAALAPTLEWTDEADFVAQAARGDSARPDRVLMYPSPDLVAAYTLVSFTPAGGDVGKLLGTDPELRQLAVEHGIRTTTQPGAMPAFARQNGVAVPVNLPTGIRLPSYDIGQALITRVEAAVAAARGPNPPASESTESVPSPVPSAGPNRTGNP